MDDLRDGGLGGGVELARVDVDGGVEGGEFALVRCEVRGGVVAEEEGARAVAGELVGACAADADGGVCACLFMGFSIGAVLYTAGMEWKRRGGRRRNLPVMMTTLPFTRLYIPTHSVSESSQSSSSLDCIQDPRPAYSLIPQIPRYTPHFRYVFERARVWEGLGQLFAQSLLFDFGVCRHRDG